MESWSANGRSVSLLVVLNYLLAALSLGCSAGEPGAPCEVRDTYPPPAGQTGSTAVARDDPAIVGWARGLVEPVGYGSDVNEEWKTPEKALGPAAGGSADIVSLGNGGTIVLTFDPAISDGEGFDLAVFENGVDDTFLELAFVEVSSDGITFVRFPGVYLGDQPVEAFGAMDTTRIGQLAGKYRNGQGTPFDLMSLAGTVEVLNGTLDPKNVGYVKIVDIMGDGNTLDCRGHPVYDPHPTAGSAGFDLDAVAVLNAAGPNEVLQ